MVRLTLTTLFAAAALAQLQPDPAGQQNIGNNRGIQFIGGACLSNLDCQSQCCAINGNFGGICSGPGAQFQQGKQGCGFVGQFPGQPGFPQQPGRPVPGQPHPGQPFPGQPFPGQPHPGQPFPGQPFPGQPVPGQPFPGQPGFPQQPFPGQPFPGQPIPGQPFPGQPGFPGQFPGQQPPIIIVYPCYDRRCRKRRKQPDVILPGLPYKLLSPGVVDQEAPGAENVGTGNGQQLELGQCFADNDCQSGCCTNPDGACAARELAEVEGGVGCGFTVDTALSVEQRVLASNTDADQVEALEAAEAAQAAELAAQQPPAKRSNLARRRNKVQA